MRWLSLFTQDDGRHELRLGCLGDHLERRQGLVPVEQGLGRQGCALREERFERVGFSRRLTSGEAGDQGVEPCQPLGVTAARRAPRGGEGQRHEPAPDVVPVGGAPSGHGDRFEPLAHHRECCTDRGGQDSLIDRPGRCALRLLQQGGGPHGVGRRLALFDHDRLDIRPEAEHQHTGGHARSDRRHHSGKGRNGRPTLLRQPLQTVAPVERGFVVAGARNVLHLGGSGAELRRDLQRETPLQRERPAQRLGGQEGDRMNVRVRRCQPVDAPDALRHTGGAPRKIVVDDALGILEIESLAE